MSITEEAVLTIAEVEVNDGYRVELRQRRRLTDYSPEQAQQLAAELTVAAADALALLAEHDRQQGVRANEHGLIAADVEPEIVSWEPRWRPPTIRAACPSCGRLGDRVASSWAGRVDGGVRATLACSKSVQSECWQVWTIDIPAKADPEVVRRFGLALNLRKDGH